MKKYEWAVVGSGIAGITIAEILTRQGHSCVLIEKNKTLASETTREFHEWFHTGALYTLVPDRLVTLKFTLGAVDDMLEYYSGFKRMNLTPTASGLEVSLNKSNSWFKDKNIHFKFRIKGRKIMLPWIYGVARALFLIKKIKQYDWLRKRAGEMEGFQKEKFKGVLKLTYDILRCNKKFVDIKTSDLTLNSRSLLRDLVATSIKNGLIVSTNNEVETIKDRGAYYDIAGQKENIRAERVVCCTAKNISKFDDVKINTSYAPIAVVKGLSKNAKSFVELDCFPSKCINQLCKDNGIGQVGGISFKDKDKCDKYLDYVMKEHKKYEPNIKELFRYNGVKSEIAFKSQPRGYVYHIVNVKKNIWAAVPGKFSLAFSLAPEFYRRIYNKNPDKNCPTKEAGSEMYNVSETIWQDIIRK
jgi:hypothetical protein